MFYIYTFSIGLPIFLLLDALWLHIAIPHFYAPLLNGFLRKDKASKKLDAHIPGAIMAYIFLLLGLTLFVVPYVIDDPVSVGTFLYGAAFGFVVYGIYEGTNFATLKKWPFKVVCVDMIWGAMIYGITTVLTVWVMQGLNLV